MREWENGVDANNANINFGKVLNFAKVKLLLLALSAFLVLKKIFLPLHFIAYYTAFIETS